jgi:tol-pal system protein YbgF
MRKSLITLTAVTALAVLCPTPQAHAVSKEIIQLQTQVQALQDAVQQLQRSNDEQMGVLQHLVEQTVDGVNRMNQAVTTLQNQMQAQEQSGGGKIDQVSTQIQGLNDSVDELRTRMGKLDTELQAIQSQLQNVNSAPATGATVPGQAPAQGAQPEPQPGAQAGATPGGQAAAPGAQPGSQPAAQSGAQDQPGAGEQAAAAPPAMMQSSAPPLHDLYQSALSDYEGAHYRLATSEFSDVVRYYPQDELAGNAQFYIGEIDYRQTKYEDAVKAYGQMLEQFEGNPKAPAARLHKAYAELATNRKTDAIHDLRSLIARYPQTPEAEQARSRLNGMGVRVVAKPSAYQQ